MTGGLLGGAAMPHGQVSLPQLQPELAASMLTYVA